MVKNIFLLFIFAVLAFAIGFEVKTLLTQNPEVQKIIKIEKPLEKYSIENLGNIEYKASPIIIERELSKSDKFTSYLISFTAENKKVTGQLNVPIGAGPFPLIVMFRGYVDQKIYQTGMGTNRAAEYFANNGFITISPDFLGYSGSDVESSNIFESRFQTYTTAITLLKSIENIENWDGKNVFIFGHSNGGQIALTVLEALQVTYPTVLWAPVSKPFPYSILYYTDESEDEGKLIRKELAKFEQDYDVQKYSLTSYLDRIKSPISLHQGTNDSAVPKTWSDTLKTKLNNIEYRTYLGADHNLQPLWSETVVNSLNFYTKHLN